MSQLGPEARRLIAATRGADDPSLADRVRMRERLDASWASSAGTLPVLKSKGVGLGVKLVAGVALLGLTGVAALHFARTEPAREAHAAGPLQPRAAPMQALEPAPASHMPRVVPDEPVREQRAEARGQVVQRAAPPVPRPRAARSAPRRAEATSPQAALRPQLHAAAGLDTELPPAAASPAAISAPAQPPRAAHQVTEPGASRRKPSAPALQPVDEELALLGAAQDALQTGKPSLALQLVRQHAFRFPRGALDRERLTVEALALCALQRKSAARQVLGELARRAPESPVLGRIRADCSFAAQ